MMDAAPELRGLLRAVVVRLGLGMAFRGVARGALWGSGGLLVLAVVGIVVPLPVPLRTLAWALGAALAAAFPFLALRCRPPVRIAARVADRRLRLDERLSTAVELLGQPGPPTGLARLQVANAVETSRGIRPRDAAPLRIPSETWKAAAALGVLLLWISFLSGWSLPGTPAAHTLVVIHREGRALVEAGRRLDAAARADRLPETRRAASRMLDLGRWLESTQVGRQEALGVLRDEARRIQTAEETVERRLAGAAPGRGPRPGERPREGASRATPEQIEGAVRRLETLIGQVRPEGSPSNRRDLLRQLGVLSESLDQMNAPGASRRKIADARRELERGRPSGATAALGDALQDLQSLERMLQDEQALGEARQQLQSSTKRIAEGGPVGEANQATAQSPPGGTPPSKTSGPNPPEGGSTEVSVPPPGPNQGSLPGQGTGGTLGTPTRRLEGTRVPERITGTPGAGISTLKDLQAPGQRTAPRLAAVRPPQDVRHEIDAALARGALPPAYLTLVRRYFEILGGGR